MENKEDMLPFVLPYEFAQKMKDLIDREFSDEFIYKTEPYEGDRILLKVTSRFPKGSDKSRMAYYRFGDRTMELWKKQKQP